MRLTSLRPAALLLAALAAAGCQDEAVPNLTNPSLDDIITNPTRAQVQSLATGLIIGNRAALGVQVLDLEIFGRDAYNLDAADPRWVDEMLGTNLDPGGFGSRNWDLYYQNIKGANVLIGGTATAEALSDEEKSATTGYARTMKALDLLYVLEARDSAGIAIDAGTSTTELAPIACREPALVRIAALLDTAATDLAAGGAAFPFVLTPGFAGFETPATFATFNRAIKARAEIYRAKNDPSAYGRALEALAGSFLDTTVSLDRGVYHVFSLASGDAVNPLYQDPATSNYRGHPSVRSDAEPNDQRVLAKTAIGPSKDYQGVGSNIVFTLYDSPTSPLPIIRNEELVLLRAQANLGLGNLPAAQTDINTIRVKSGGLAPRTYSSAEEALDDLLAQKRFSLLFESGSRWVDARLYGRLDALPLDLPDHVVHPNLEIPRDEAIARDPSGVVACTP
jgi:starch-binding outer membrane protein, SusD/RagB family